MVSAEVAVLRVCHDKTQQVVKPFTLHIFTAFLFQRAVSLSALTPFPKLGVAPSPGVEGLAPPCLQGGRRLGGQSIDRGLQNGYKCVFARSDRLFKHLHL